MPNLTVALNGIEVGKLTLDRSGAMAFQYDPRWLERPGARAISLSLPLSPASYRGERVYNFFDNLLPDSDAIRARMQARFQVPTRHPFDLLSSVGRDCIGAIQLYPEDSLVPDIRGSGSCRRGAPRRVTFSSSLSAFWNTAILIYEKVVKMNGCAFKS